MSPILYNHRSIRLACDDQMIQKRGFSDMIRVQKSTVLGTPLMVLLLLSISMPLLSPLAHAIYDFKNVRRDTIIRALTLSDIVISSWFLCFL